MAKMAVQRKLEALQKQRKQGKLSIARNRSAQHEYEFLDSYEAGIELTGSEVKSLRERGCQITDGFCLVRQGQAWLHGVHIHPYSHGGVWNVDPDRKRRLLLHKKEIRFLENKLREKGIAFVPVELYFNEDNRVKVRVALARGRKLYDKRENMAKRDMDREIQRALKYVSR